MGERRRGERERRERERRKRGKRRGGRGGERDRAEERIHVRGY